MSEPQRGGKIVWTTVIDAQSLGVVGSQLGHIENLYVVEIMYNGRIAGTSLRGKNNTTSCRSSSV